MNSNNFFIQLFSRLFSSNPKFFKIIQVISLVCAAITGLPELLSYFGITLPTLWVTYENLAVAKAALVIALIAQLPKNDPPASGTGTASASTGTAPVAKMLLFLVSMTFLASAASAQSFFHRLPKPQPAYLADAPRYAIPHALGLTAPSTDSTMNAVRPITIAAAYSEPGNILMAGAGLSYQHLTYSTSTGLWSCQWSVSAVGFAGGSVAPSTPASIMSVGVLGGFLNNLVEIGPCYNFGTKQVGVAVAMGINFNN